MLLEDKNAVVYGAGGAIGGAVAQAFAREGAKVFLTGRTLAKVRTSLAESDGGRPAFLGVGGCVTCHHSSTRT
jgi:3-oxoacyl-[acyl-carrier protein] reductase